MVLEDELTVAALLASVWTAERAASFVKASPLLGDIVAGICFSSVAPYTDAFRLLGLLGVMLLVVDGGLAVDIATVRALGVRAFAVALAGVVVPVALCFAYVTGVLGLGWRAGLSVGAAIAPTSLGFSAKLMMEFNIISSPLGQLICTAAVIDDVLSLALVAEISALSGDDDSGGDSLSAWDISKPIVASLGSIVCGLYLAILLPTHVITPLLDRVFPVIDNDDDDDDDAAEMTEVGVTAALRHRQRGDVLLFAVLAYAATLAWCCAIVESSALLGCFFAGLAFSSYPELAAAWHRNAHRAVVWGSRLFFACTIAFGVPSVMGDDGIFQLQPFTRGLVLAVCAIAGKMVCGLFAVGITSSMPMVTSTASGDDMDVDDTDNGNVGNDSIDTVAASAADLSSATAPSSSPPLRSSTPSPRFAWTPFFQIGWAMCGRGEFSFLIADAAASEGVIDDEQYSAVIWALLLSTLTAPFAFRYFLHRERRQLAHAVLQQQQQSQPLNGQQVQQLQHQPPTVNVVASASSSSESKSLLT